MYGVRSAPLGYADVVDYTQFGRDPDLDVVRLGVRDYDPRLGQFLTPDPLFFESLEKCVESPLECSLYGYASGNPLSFVDPSGMNEGVWEWLLPRALGAWRPGRAGALPRPASPRAPPTGGIGGKPVSHGQVIVTTAGELRCIGCDVVPSPGAGENHVTVTPGPATPAQISEQFVQRPNPARLR